MTKHIMKPLAQKVTQEELDKHAHDPENHFGSNPDFKGVFHFLKQMGAVGGPGQVAFDIYGDGPLNEETEAMKRAGKSQQTAGERRLEGLRYGRRSFTPVEAQYFHDAFRQVCGDDWANAISVRQFVTQPINVTMSELVSSGLPTPWDELNPANALKILALASLTEANPTIRIQRYSDERLSRQGQNKPINLETVEKLEQLRIDEEFRVCIENLPTASDAVVLEYMHEPMRGEEFNFAVQGQIMHHVRRSGTNAYVTAEDNQPLKVEPTLGRFGFCLIVANVPSGLEGLLPVGVSNYFSNEDLRDLVRTARSKLAKGEVTIVTTDYEVVK